VIVWLFAGVILFFAAMMAVRGFAAADPAQLARWIRTGSGWALAGLTAILVVRGRWDFAVLTGMGAAALLRLQLPFGLGRGPWTGAQPKSTGQRSTVTTDWVEATLDHDTGAMEGTIRRGRFTGQELGALSLDEILIVLDEAVTADPQGAQLIEAFIDRTFGEAWREGRGPSADGTNWRPPRPGEVRMSRTEALRVLGLMPGASPEDIRAAHRRLMMDAHPDRGGSDAMAAKLNEAKSVLLGL